MAHCGNERHAATLTICERVSEFRAIGFRYADQINRAQREGDRGAEVRRDNGLGQRGDRLRRPRIRAERSTTARRPILLRQLPHRRRRTSLYNRQLSGMVCRSGAQRSQRVAPPHRPRRRPGERKARTPRGVDSRRLGRTIQNRAFAKEGPALAEGRLGDDRQGNPSAPRRAQSGRHPSWRRRSIASRDNFARQAGPRQPGASSSLEDVQPCAEADARRAGALA